MMNHNGTDLTEIDGRKKLIELSQDTPVRVLLRYTKQGGNRTEWIVNTPTI